MCSRAESVRAEHWPMFSTCKSARVLQIFPKPSSVILQEMRERWVRLNSPLAMWSRARSETLSQKDKSKVVRPTLASAKYPTPISVMLSQDLRLRLRRELIFDRDFMPESDTFAQKLRLSWESPGLLIRLCERCRSAVSLTFWQSWRLSCCRDSADDDKCITPLSDTCQQERRFKLRNFLRLARTERLVLVIPVHPPRSRTSRLGHFITMTRLEASVKPLQRLRFSSTRESTVRETSSLRRARAKIVSLIPAQPDMSSDDSAGRLEMSSFIDFVTARIWIFLIPRTLRLRSTHEVDSLVMLRRAVEPRQISFVLKIFLHCLDAWKTRIYRYLL